MNAMKVALVGVIGLIIVMSLIVSTTTTDWGIVGTFLPLIGLAVAAVVIITLFNKVGSGK